MAGVAPRTILVCAFPAVLSLLTFLWIRKRKKNSNAIDYSNTNGTVAKTVEARTCIDDSSSETTTEDSTVAEMHIKEHNESQADLEDAAGFGKGEKLHLPLGDENSVTCSSCDDKIVDSGCLDVANHLAQLTVSETDAEGAQDEVDNCSIDESTVLKKNHKDHFQEQDSSSPCISTFPEIATLNTVEIVSSCDESNAPNIVIQSSVEEPQSNGDFLLSELKLFKIDSGDGQELDTIAPIGSFDSVNFSEMDDLIDSPPHSTYSDIQSEGSSDSGKGGSDIQVGSDLSQTTIGEEAVLIYEFELPQELCGRLIGRLGKHVNFIKTRSGANVFIKRNIFNPRIKICAVEGNQSEIKNALELIRKRFPLSQFSNLNLTQVNIPIPCGVMVPETLQLHLPEGITSDVILSSMVSAGHFFVQQPTHPTYPSLNRLDQCMLVCYSQMETPELPQPVEVGVICAAPMMDGWYRASVVHVYDNSEDCDVKFVDYGGYSCTSVSSLRQIRSDFMTLPFQASECYLANVKPPDDNSSWSLEACATFEELAQGQILQSLIVAHADDGVPYVHLYRIQGVSTIFINRELVNRGVAQWVEHQL